MDNINDILSSKRDWRKAERRREDRRKYCGSAADRKDLADALRFGRHRDRTSPLYYCHCMHCEYLRHKVWPWWKKAWKAIFPVILVVLMAGSAQAATASWYSQSDAYIKPLTASGEVFNDRGLTAASWGFPLGSWVKVTNIKNHRSIVVRINDHGPARRLYRKGRIIDLTRESFSRISPISDGVIHVTIRRLYVYKN